MSGPKIALIGSAPSSVRLAPYGDESWQIWGCSPGTYGVMPRVTEFFELHLYEPGAPWFSPEYCQWLAALPARGVTLWTGAPIAQLPGSKVLPAQELLAKYDPCGWFCSSSIFWMMARAIEIGASKIGMWGIDMAAGEEYQMQRAGLHFLTYVARARGIEVGVPMESDLFTPRFRYGVDEHTHSFRKWRARRAELVQRRDAAEATAKQGADAAHFLKGAIEDVDYMHDTWVTKDSFTGPDARDIGKAFAPPLPAELSSLEGAAVQIVTAGEGVPSMQPYEALGREGGRGRSFDAALRGAGPRVT